MTLGRDGEQGQASSQSQCSTFLGLSRSGVGGTPPLQPAFLGDGDEGGVTRPPFLCSRSTVLLANTHSTNICPTPTGFQALSWSAGILLR